MKHLLLLLLAAVAFTGEAPVNPAIKSTMDAFEADAAKAYGEYLKATTKMADKAVKDLDVKFKAAMKKGDLTAATAIKMKMDEIDKGQTLANLETTWKAKREAIDLLNVPGSIRVISATHSANGQTFDITEMVQDKFDTDKKPFVLDSKVFGDPVPGSHKTLVIIYTIDGKKKSATFLGWATIDPSKL